MSDFDPNTFLSGGYDAHPKQLKKEEFNPDTFLSGGYDTRRPESAGSSAAVAQTALENYGDTMTMGYLPHLQAIAEKPMTAILNAVTGNDVQADDYLKARDSNRKRIENESSENPKAAIAGKVAGIVNQAPLLAGKAVQGAGALQKILSAAKTGGIYGAIQNPGDTEGEFSPIQLKERATNAGVGAVIGGGIQGAVEAAPYVARGAKKVADAAGGMADEKAAKVLGHLSKAEIAAEKGTLRQIGKVLREEGAIKPWTTTGSASRSVERIRQEAGQEIGKIIENANPGTKIDTAKMAEALRSSETLQEMAKTPGMEAAYTRINGMLDTLARNGEVDLKQAQKLRQMVDRGIKFARRGDSPVPEEGLKAIRTTVRNTMNDAVNASDELAGVGGKDRLLAANKKYSLMAEAGDIADQQLARNAKNRTISLTDTVMGATGVATGGPVTGVAAALANKAGRTFGNAAMSSAYGGIERVLRQIPKFAAIAEQNPELFNSYVQRISQRGRMGAFESIPDQLEKFYLSTDAPPVKGEDKWANDGVAKLGLDPETASRALASKEGKRLLIEASDLKPGSPKLEAILKKLSNGRGQ